MGGAYLFVSKLNWKPRGFAVFSEGLMIIAPKKLVSVEIELH